MTDALETGWTPGLNVRQSVSLLPAGHPIAFALISVIDSTPAHDISDLEPRLDDLERAHWTVPGGVLIELATLRLLIDAGSFDGFDEVWLFESRPDDDTPAPPRFTSDAGGDFEAPAELEAWMRDAGCSAALGDGIELNYATFDPALAALWR